MTREDAFLEAIVEEPEDDGVRLICADWLEEHGDLARAEFIRVQIERARLLDNDPRQWDLADREQQLLTEHAAAWTVSLSPFVLRCGFRRGFVEEIVVRAAMLVSHAAILFRLAPVRHLAVRDVVVFSNQLDAAARTAPLLEFAHRWLTIDLARENIQRRGMRSLMDRWDCFPALTRLNLRGNGLDRPCMEWLADTPLLGQLHFLDLGVHHFEGTPWVGLLKSPFCERLRELGLGHNGLTAEQIPLLGNAPGAQRLQRLDLSFNPLGPAGAHSLAVLADALPDLQDLNLSRTGLGDEGLLELSRGPLLGRLHTLDLSLNRLGDEGARALLDYPSPTQLHRLDLIYNAISTPLMEKLRERFGERVCLFRR